LLFVCKFVEMLFHPWTLVKAEQSANGDTGPKETSTMRKSRSFPFRSVITTVFLLALFSSDSVCEPLEQKIREAVQTLKFTHPNDDQYAILDSQPDSVVIPTLIAMMQSDTTFRSREERNAAYYLLQRRNLLANNAGFGFLISCLDDPILQARCLHELLTVTDDRRDSVASLLVPYLNDPAQSDAFKAAVFRALGEMEYKSNELRNIAIEAFSDQSNPESLRWAAARDLVINSGIGSVVEMLSKADPVGLKVGLWAIATEGEKSNGNLKAARSVKIRIQDLIIKGIRKADSESRKGILETVSLLFGDDLVATVDGKRVPNPDLLDALRYASGTEQDEEVRSLIADAIDAMVLRANESKEK
jgi:hypothetical protein